MTDERELSLILDRWFTDGPTEMPDRVIDVVAAGIARQRQRPAWRLDWRPWSMQNQRSIGAAVVAVGVVIVVVLVAIGPRLGGSAVGGSPTVPTLSPGPTASPSSAATSPSTAVISSPAGPVAVDFPTVSIPMQPATWRYSGATPGFTLVLAETGWEQSENDDHIAGMRGGDGPFFSDRIEVRYLMRAVDPGDGCLGTQTVGAGHTAADLVAAIRARDGLTVAAPKATAVSGYPAQSINVSLAAGAGTKCTLELQPAMAILTTTDGTEEWTLRIDKDERARVIAVDLPGGEVAVVVISSADGSTFDELTAKAGPIVDSIKFAGS